ncbi:hypothetical protein QBC47DRAFT_357926 [Echria macrotheca]|uniref:Uncharacterized protein n=1 Tax=Echria macrotheca TaxID=438768 RepID=A0AAJ0BGY3_9PEZI|nr:hypothetical protein QBC47DRAFT_357926 [Echria macrotheca]
MSETNKITSSKPTSTPNQQPNPTHPSQTATSFLAWFSEYLNAIIGIAALGGQITFTVIVSDIADPSILGNNAPDDAPRTVLFDKERVRLLIALSWLFFTTTLGLAVVAKILFANSPPPDSAEGRVAFGRMYTALTFLLNGIPVAAFLLLALATVAYVPVVGWIGVAVISLFGLFVGFLWFVLDAGISW